MHSLSTYVLLLTALCMGSSLSSQIILDELYDDWSELDIYLDGDDVEGGGVDILATGATMDSDYLYLYLQVERNRLLQETDGLQVLLDIDNDVNTGELMHGLGVDLLFDFGARAGVSALDVRRGYSHDDIGLISSPTVSSSEWEMLIRRTAPVDSEIDYVISDSCKYVWRFTGGDVAPDQGTLNVDRADIYDREYSTDLSVAEGTDLRVLSYNVLRDRPLESSSARSALGRVLRTLDPDVIAFQEIYEHSSLEVAAMVNTLYPPDIGEQWYHAQVQPDIILVSKANITATRSSDGNGYFRISHADRDWLIVNCHLPCCENDFGRRQEIDRILQILRDIQAGTHPLEVQEDAPVIILGDMNLVGSNETRDALLLGDIDRNGLYGPDFDPDWGRGALTDAVPLTTGLPATISWNPSGGSFSPGRLDYITYSSSSVEVLSSGALLSSALSPEALAATELREDDTDRISDHLPLFADFRAVGTVSTADPLARTAVGNGVLKYYLRAGSVHILPNGTIALSLISPYAGHVHTMSVEADRLTVPEITPGMYIASLLHQDGTSSHQLWLIQ